MVAESKRTAASADDNKIIPISVDRLLLDFENPRLASSRGGDTQEDLLRVLWKEMAVDEVALSIAANGFFAEENLFVIPEDSREKDEDKRKYIVVEGNRRLAAVKLLLDQKLRERIKATDLPTLSAQGRDKLKTLPVSIYKGREDLWAYFGFRHINGPKEWDAFSKATYVAYVKENYGIPLDEIARKIGDQHSSVKRFYRGYVVLKQAEEQADFDREDRIRNKFYFSHLYTALDQPGYQKFLGITAENSLKPNPVPKSKLKELKELMVYIYGSKTEHKQPIVQSQSPDLNILREVIGQPRALSALRAGYSLGRSHEIARGDKRRFEEALTTAKEDLMEANGTVTLGYAGDDDLYEVMQDISRLAQDLTDAMEKKRKQQR